MTCVAYINKKGGRRKDLNEIARQIWLWAEEHNVWISAAEHLPGILNTEADKASRKEYACETEWQLNPDVFHAIERKFGPFQIDLFALQVECSMYTILCMETRPLCSCNRCFCTNMGL